MTHTILTIQNYLLNPVSELLTLIGNLKFKYLNHREQRSAVKELRALTDRQLNDMGITRGEIHDVVYNGVNRNLKDWV